jgi:small subunit ribosomal protein S4
LALRQDERQRKEPILMKSLARIGLVSNDSTLDDVLNLQVDDLLSRRLQSIVTKKLGFKTPYQARQAIIHGHIMIKDRKVDIPSYIVTLAEEDGIHFTPGSKIPEILEKTNKSGQKSETSEDSETSTSETTADTAADTTENIQVVENSQS